MNKLPDFLNQSIQANICIICEGHEEYTYLNRLSLLEVWNQAYHIKLINAEGNGNIPAIYEDQFRNDSFDIVFVFCDTERKPYEQYNDIKRKISAFHDLDTGVGSIIIYANPCTMQVILSHWGDVHLTTASKKANRQIILSYTGIENYKAKKEQLEILMDQLTIENYQAMCHRVLLLKDDDTVVGSSNFRKLIEFLSSTNEKWIQEINQTLEI